MAMRSVCDPREERDGDTKGAACQRPCLPQSRAGWDASATCSSQRGHTVSSERQAEALSQGNPLACLPGREVSREDKGTSLPTPPVLRSPSLL